jgi:hypothetical protein
MSLRKIYRGTPKTDSRRSHPGQAGSLAGKRRRQSASNLARVDQAAVLNVTVAHLRSVNQEKVDTYRRNCLAGAGSRVVVCLGEQLPRSAPWIGW